MSEEINAANKKENNWVGRLLKLVFVLSAFFLVGITVLSNMGGNSDSWKGSVEQFASGLFGGRPARVERLVYMSFFPKIGFSADNVSIYSTPDEKIVLASIGKVQGFMGFWNVAFRTQKFAHFYLENFSAVKGAITPEELNVEKVFIDHDIENETALLRGNGEIGINKWEIYLGLNVFDSHDILDSKAKFNFSVPDEFPFELNIADTNLKGDFVRGKGNYYKFKDFTVLSGDKVVVGNVVLSALGQKLLKIKGDVEVSKNQNKAEFDLIFDYSHSPAKVSGSMVIDNNTVEEIMFLFMHVRELIGYVGVSEEKDIKDWKAMFDFGSVKVSPELSGQE